ncbi:GM10725 [Drosophila sechellia]|uniref:GM10725 n=1 Tax=Drosophila sechellia TaxID=7238 RepID=B4I3J7_DROSE|nr:GM10725 [Drosophila sechellia]
MEMVLASALAALGPIGSHGGRLGEPQTGSGGTGRDPQLHFALYFGSRCDLSRFEVTSAGEKLNVESVPPSEPHPVRRKTKQALPTPESPIELPVQEM